MDIKNRLNGGEERLLTGLALLGVAIIVVLIDAWFENHFITWLALGAILYFAFEEMLKILKIEGKALYYCIVPTWFIAYLYPHPEILTFGVLIAVAGAMAYQNNINYKMLYPIIYPFAPMLFLFALPQLYGIQFLVWLVFIVGMTDTAAYYGGKSIGVTPFSEVSPKKTWEGVYSGLVAGTIVGVIVGLFMTSFLTALAVSFFTALASVFGDLFESYLKRSVGLKDSGSIFPGHGGMLDRADGYLFGAVAMIILLGLIVQN